MVQAQNIEELLIITGPTCSGKSAIALETAAKTGGEIVSCDSMQIYKYMDIGTAKPDKNQLKAVRHHMIDIIEPDADYSVGLYRDGADAAINSVQKAGKKTIVTGGTGLYIKSLLYPQSLGGAAKDPAVREKYELMLKEKGAEYIYRLLEKTDQQAAKVLHINDTKRVIRALEICTLSGKTKTELSLSDKAQPDRYKYKLFVLNPEREKLYNNINSRVDDMIKNGLIEETEGLLKRGYTENLNSMKAIGYAETIKYLKGEAGKAETIELIKQNTRHYAKRQITFFKGFKDAVWLDINTIGVKECIQRIL